MLEILILIRLGNKIAAQARAKGRSGWPFVLVLIALWVGGEIGGAVVGVVVSVVALGDDEPNVLLAVLGGICGAVIGAVVAFQVVKSVGPAYTHDEDDYERPTRDRDYDRY